MSKESRLMKNTAIIAIGNICTKCIGFFMLPLYTSLLSTEQFGTVDLVTTYSTLLITIMTLQFEQGLFRFLIDARGNQIEQRKLITTAFASITVVNALFAVCVGGVLSVLGYQYTSFLIAIVISGAFYGVLLQIPRGLGDNTTYAIGSCIGGSLHVILNCLFIAVFGLGVEGMLLATMLSNIVAVVFVCIKMKLHKYISLRHLERNAFFSLMKYSLPLIPYTMCWWIINASDRIIINVFLGAAANGVYAAAYKFPSLFSMVTNIFQLAWTESASENVKDKQRDKYYNNTVNSTIRFYSSCNIGIIALMPFVFDLLIKKDFTSAYYYIPILMTAAFLHAVAALYGSIYFAFKETKKVAYTTVLSAVVNIVINVLFIKEIGLFAAAFSSLCAYFLIIVIRVIDLKKKVSIHISKKYLLAETLIYIAVMLSYYCGSIVVKAVVLLLLIPYCVIQNREILVSVLRVFKEKMQG